MGKKDLTKILKKGYYPSGTFMCSLDGSTILVNDYLAIRDDPNLLNYLSKNKEMKPESDKVYYLDPNLEIIKKDVNRYIIDKVKDLFEMNDKNRRPLFVPEHRVIIDFGDKKGYALFLGGLLSIGEELNDAIFIDTDYFEYLDKTKSIHSLDLFLDRKKAVVYSVKDDKVDWIVAPLTYAANIKITRKDIEEFLIKNEEE